MEDKMLESSGRLQEVQGYIEGELLYIPSSRLKREWGAVSGSRRFNLERNRQIRTMFQKGRPIEELPQKFGLSVSTIKRIIYQKK